MVDIGVHVRMDIISITLLFLSSFSAVILCSFLQEGNIIRLLILSGDIAFSSIIGYQFLRHKIPIEGKKARATIFAQLSSVPVSAGMLIL